MSFERPLNGERGGCLDDLLWMAQLRRRQITKTDAQQTSRTGFVNPQGSTRLVTRERNGRARR